MATECLNLVVSKNTSKAYELQFKEDGIGVSIEGWTVYFTVKAKMTDSDDNAIIKKDITSHSDANSGKTVIELLTSDTDKDIGDYWYDIKYKDDEGNADIILKGKFTIKRPVTTRG